MNGVILALRSALGAEAVLTGDDIAERYKHDWRGETAFTPRALMQTIKQALDPKGIQNAGKMRPGPDSGRAD